MKFQLRLGGKYVANGREFVPGDIVESDTDLTKKFKKRWIKVDDDKEVSVGKPFNEFKKSFETVAGNTDGSPRRKRKSR